MKLAIVILALFVAEAALEPQYYHGSSYRATGRPSYGYGSGSYHTEMDEDDNSDSDRFSEENLMKEIQRSMNDVFYAAEKIPIVGPVLVESIEAKCIYDKYVEANLTKLIVDRSQSRDKIYIFLSFSAQCSSKVDTLLEFVFENFMSYRILYKSFASEPSIKNYTSYVHCANKYAIDNRFFYETVNGVKLEVADDNDEACHEAQLLFEAAVIKFKSEIRKETERICSMKTVDKLVKFAFKTVLLLQVDLSAEQKQQESEKFVKEAHKVLDDGVKCFTTGTKSDLDQSISTLMGKNQRSHY